MSIDVCFQWAVHWHIGYINLFSVNGFTELFFDSSVKAGRPWVATRYCRHRSVVRWSWSSWNIWHSGTNEWKDETSQMWGGHSDQQWYKDRRSTCKDRFEKTRHKMCRHQLNGWAWKNDEKVRCEYQTDRSKGHWARRWIYCGLLCMSSAMPDPWLPSQLQSNATPPLPLIFCPAQGRRLSWPNWLVNQGAIPRNRWMITNLCTNQAKAPLFIHWKCIESHPCRSNREYLFSFSDWKWDRKCQLFEANIFMFFDPIFRSGKWEKKWQRKIMLPWRHWYPVSQC